MNRRLTFVMIVAAVAACAPPEASKAPSKTSRSALEPSVAVPTLWDTAWVLGLADQGTIGAYLDARADEGFDAIMFGMNFNASNEPMGNGQRPFNAGDLSDVTEPNDAGFAYVDWIISEINARGMTACFLPVSNGSGDSYTRALVNDSVAYGFGLYLGNRYPASRYPKLVWVLGGDATGSAVAELTRPLAQGLDDAGGTQSKTAHIANSPGRSSDWFNGEGWITFHMLQSQSFDSGMYILDDAHNRSPSISGLGEGFYENLTWPDPSHTNDGPDVRGQAWRVFLSQGSYYTYGQAGVMDGTSYADASLPGARMVKIARDYVVEKNWRTMTGAPSRSSTGFFLGDEASPARYLAYQPGSGAFDVQTQGGDFDLEWLSPADGSRTSGGRVTLGGGWNTLTPPFGGDAVAYLTGASGGGFTPIRVNTGGGAYTDPNGTVWSADTAFVGGNVYSVSDPIDGTIMPDLYQSERWGFSDYVFSVPNGTYAVTLKFAEIYWSGPGQRLFAVDLNGQRVLSNFDVFATAGGAYRALDETFNVTVSDGRIDLHFTDLVDNGKIAAIEIVQAGSP